MGEEQLPAASRLLGFLTTRTVGKSPCCAGTHSAVLQHNMRYTRSGYSIARLLKKIGLILKFTLQSNAPLLCIILPSPQTVLFVISIDLSVAGSHSSLEHSGALPMFVSSLPLPQTGFLLRQT